MQIQIQITNTCTNTKKSYREGGGAPGEEGEGSGKGKVELMIKEILLVSYNIIDIYIIELMNDDEGFKHYQRRWRIYD